MLQRVSDAARCGLVTVTGSPASATKSSVGQRSTKIAFCPPRNFVARSVCHAARSRGRGFARPAGPVDLGVLTSEITPELVDEVIDLSGCREKRQRLLPARAVMYFVLGLCLFSGADSCAPPGYRSVMRWLTNGVRHLHGMTLPTSPALTRARQRLGSKPLELLFDLRRGPLAGERDPGGVRVRAAAGRLGRDRDRRR